MLGALWPVVLVDMANGRRFDARFLARGVYGTSGLRDQRSSAPFRSGALPPLARPDVEPRSGLGPTMTFELRRPSPCSSARPADFMIKQLGGGTPAWGRCLVSATPSQL